MPDKQEPLTPAEMKLIQEIRDADDCRRTKSDRLVLRALAMLDQLEEACALLKLDRKQSEGMCQHLAAENERLKADENRLRRATAERCAEIASEAADEWNNAGVAGEVRRTGVSAANEIAERIEREFNDAAIQREGQ
jgi:hypothetical protein